MTHAEFRASHPTVPGILLEPSHCPGELAETTTMHDPAADGHEVAIYRCADCGATIVLDRTAGVVRNDYPDWTRLAARLAEQMRSPRR
jgi:hypothetical protein